MWPATNIEKMNTRQKDFGCSNHLVNLNQSKGSVEHELEQLSLEKQLQTFTQRNLTA